MSYATAEARCAAEGKYICDHWDPRWDCGNRNLQQQWGTGTCFVQAQVHPDGRVSAIHRFKHTEREDRAQVRTKKGADKFPFRVLWDGSAPKPLDGHFPAEACEPMTPSSDDTGAVPSTGDVNEETLLLCNATVVTEAVITQTPRNMSDITDVLTIGAPDPASFDEGTYTMCTTKACNDLMKYDRAKVYFHVNSTGGMYDEKTIFWAQVRRNKWKHLANYRSSIQIGSGSNSFSFRNPPQFNAHWEPASRDAYHETDAALDLYVEHENVPPFVADFMIKRFTSSNPSPGYVERVATAFQRGQHEWIGSGQYGDMAATIAAVLLDPEALSPRTRDGSHLRQGA